MVRIATNKGGWFSMDEIGFGPRREPRPPSRRLRRLTVAGSIAGGAAAAIAIAVTAAGGQRSATPPPPVPQSAVLPAPVLRPPSAICPPAEPTWPSLAGLPAGLHAGAVPIVVDEQFSGACPAR
jgi:hypothetical protein